jgi:gliding motility-associated-like protein
MIRGSGFNIRKVILSILLFSGATSSLLSQGTPIGGVINEYMDVVSIDGTDNLTLSDADIFSPGDTVLLIQMKGAVILGYEATEYGNYQYSLGNPGSYEFLIIQSVNYLTRHVIFSRNILNIYDIAGLVQLVKVHSYNSARVTSELTCLPWDSVTTKTGGVLALIVGGTLTLEAGINVSGKGLAGGTALPGDGICLSTNTALYGKYAYPDTYTNSGFKGESHVSRSWLSAIDIPSVYPDFAKGKGANFTGGGGGNGRYSGGGGGSGSGSGGKGGRENSLCGPPEDGGLGGKQIINTTLEGKILMGGGGGSSTSESGSTATPGGKGGGVIIIVCDTLKSNGIHTITANGESAAIATGNAGAGGGGGAGTLALYQQSFSLQTASSELRIFATGGNGGNTSTNNGEGGGGGGGLILTNALTFPARVDTSTAGGSRGTRGIGQRYSENGKYGKAITTFLPLLNGFLFNTIRSSVSFNQIDSVCSNMSPPKIIGTKPVGGTGPYAFIWEKSYESTFAASIALANDTDPTNYTPTLADAITPTDTVWFRRTVTDAGFPQITDVSKAVKIIVHPGISNNNIGDPDIFCETGTPLPIKQTPPDLIVPSTSYLFFTWQDSTNSTESWTNIPGSVNISNPEYQPPTLTATTSYRRIVVSGSCIDISLTVKMTVLPVITGNSIFSPADDSICSGTELQTIRGTKETGTTPVLEGGNNTFAYKWETNNNYSGWITADTPSDRDSLTPGKLPERIPWNDYVFRRIVFSGTDSSCKDTSNIVIIKDFPKITTNNIYPADQTICSGSALMISGNLPNNGNNIYTWQDSTNSSAQWNDIPGFAFIPDLDHQTPVLTQTTSYRRIAYSSGCSDTSNSAKITVQPPITGNNIYLEKIGGSPDTTICSGQTHDPLIGTIISGGIYQWFYSTTSGNLTPVPGATQANYPNPQILNVPTFFRRLVSSGVCSDTSISTITINVLSPISNNVITPDQPSVCENTVPGSVTGSTVAGGSGTYIYLWEQSTDGGTNWTAADGTNTLAAYQPAALANTIQYRRNVSSADCLPSVSPAIEITIDPAPQGPVNAGADESILSLDGDYSMNADPPVISGETGFWTVLEPGTADIVSTADSKSEVRNLTTGRNLFVWSITNGLCNIEDSVYIELLPYVIPQGFSPNEDGWNNKFIIEGLNLSEEQTGELTILNGAGTVVFTTSNRNGQEWVDWDGRNNKGIELPEGTYYYLLTVTTNENRVFRKSGFVELKRN